MKKIKHHSYIELYKRIKKLALLNKEGFMYKLLYSKERNVLRTFIFMCIATERTDEIDLLILGKWIYDNFIDYK